MTSHITLAQAQPTSPPVATTSPSAETLSSIPAVPTEAADGFLDQLLAFTYTLAHWAGQLIVAGLNALLDLQASGALDSLVDPIGYLALLTVFLIVAEVAKKITWIVVVVGWVLITVRVVLEVLQQQ